MTDLYQRNGGIPAPLPPIAYDDRNYAFTAPYVPGDLALLGFKLAPAQPNYDPATQRVDWIDGAWVVSDLPPDQEPEPDPFANFIPVPLLRQRIEALGMWDAFAAYLAQNPAEMLKVLTVEVGVDPAYPALGVAFEAMDVPQAARDVILAPPSAGVNWP